MKEKDKNKNKNKSKSKNIEKNTNQAKDKKTVNSSYKKSKPKSKKNNFNTPTTKKLLAFIAETRKKFLEGIGTPVNEKFVTDSFQQEAINSITKGEDVLVVAPTGAGKTHIAIESFKSILNLGGRVVYTTPLKALSNTKYNEFKKLFEPEYSVGLLTGDRKIDTKSDVIIATTEIYRNELFRENVDYSLVVLDEVHFIADQQRGPVWEESIILSPKDTTLLMLSASVSNADEIIDWLEFVREKKCNLVTKDVRPVELRLGFLHPQFGPIPLENEKGSVLSPITEFYADTSLDSEGMKLTGGRYLQRRKKRYNNKNSNKNFKNKNSNKNKQRFKK